MPGIERQLSDPYSSHYNERVIPVPDTEACDVKHATKIVRTYIYAIPMYASN